MNYKQLWINLYNMFLNTNKTGWGKNEIVKVMKDAELDMARDLKEVLE